MKRVMSITLAAVMLIMGTAIYGYAKETTSLKPLDGKTALEGNRRYRGHRRGGRGRGGFWIGGGRGYYGPRYYGGYYGPRRHYYGGGYYYGPRYRTYYAPPPVYYAPAPYYYGGGVVVVR